MRKKHPELQEWVVELAVVRHSMNWMGLLQLESRSRKNWLVAQILELEQEMVQQTIHLMSKGKDLELVVPVVALPRSRRQKDLDRAWDSSRYQKMLVIALT